jgi:hypothetical protein
MSAFIVDNRHIDAIVTYAIAKRVRYFNPGNSPREKWIEITARNAEEIGRILLDENVRSVAHRYSNRINDDERNASAIYAYRPFPTPLAAVEFIKACKCLEYQSCETDDWETTLAYRILRACIDSASSDLRGYERAPWEISDNSMKELQHAGQIALSSLIRRKA